MCRPLWYTIEVVIFWYVYTNCITNDFITICCIIIYKNIVIINPFIREVNCFIKMVYTTQVRKQNDMMLLVFCENRILSYANLQSIMFKHWFRRLNFLTKNVSSTYRTVNIVNLEESKYWFNSKLMIAAVWGAGSPCFLILLCAFLTCSIP